MLRLNGFAAAVAISVSAAACSMSTQQEMQMGAQYAAQLNSKLPMVNDASANRYINALGDQLARAGRRGINYTFYIVNSDVVNAFAVPGGYVYVNRGLIERTRNMSELAGVLAHEIGHVEHRHGAEQMERMQTANLGVNLAYILLGRQPGAVEATAVNVAGTAYFARHSRQAENEADESAVPMLIAAGIHPNGLVSMFELLVSMQNRSPSTMESWFSTHPTTRDRIQHTRSVIGRYSAAQLRNLATSSSSYNSMKSRLRALPAAPRS
ncbi:MAG TPA: M48 family metallopeptidase [Longimicrobiales bacterium]